MDVSFRIFEDIKKVINECPELFFLNVYSPIHLYTDASDEGIGAYLTQVVESIECPIAFIKLLIGEYLIGILHKRYLLCFGSMVVFCSEIGNSKYTMTMRICGKLTMIMITIRKSRDGHVVFKIIRITLFPEKELITQLLICSGDYVFEMFLRVTIRRLKKRKCQNL